MSKTENLANAHSGSESKHDQETISTIAALSEDFMHLLNRQKF